MERCGHYRRPDSTNVPHRSRERDGRHVELGQPAGATGIRLEAGTAPGATNAANAVISPASSYTATNVPPGSTVCACAQLTHRAIATTLAHQIKHFKAGFRTH